MVRMRRILKLDIPFPRAPLGVFALISLVMMVGCSKKGYIEYNGNIQGVVLDNETGEPVEGAEILASYAPISAYDYWERDNYFYSLPYTITNDKGEYVLAHVKEYGPNTITIFKTDGYKIGSERISKPIPHSTIVEDLLLTPYPVEIQFDPDTLVFETGVSQLILTISNIGSNSLKWVQFRKSDWLFPSAITGHLNPNDSAEIVMEIYRNSLIGEFSYSDIVQGAIFYGIEETGERYTIIIEVHQ